MMAVINHDEDVSTVFQWCDLLEPSRSSLYALCSAIGVVPKAALDLARLLRASRESEVADLRDAFLVADPRTVARLLHRAGISLVDSVPLRDDLLKRQRLILDPRILDRLAHCLR